MGSKKKAPSKEASTELKSGNNSGRDGVAGKIGKVRLGRPESSCRPLRRRLLCSRNLTHACAQTFALLQMMRRMSVTGHAPRMHLEGLTPSDVVLLKEIGSGMTAFAYVSKVKTKAQGNIVAVAKVMNKCARRRPLAPAAGPPRRNAHTPLTARAPRLLCLAPPPSQVQPVPPGPGRERPPREAAPSGV